MAFKTFDIRSEVRAESFWAKVVLILLIGVLSIFFGEVYAGASPLWFLIPWGIFVTFPLYLAHTLLFINLAIKSKRTSLSSLYLWGILFALYESWISKVIWAGYGATAPILGTVGGIAIYETITLSLFWHPVMSFIMPIAAFHLLAHHALPKGAMFPSIQKLLEKSKLKWLFLYYISIVGAINLSYGSGRNILVAAITFLGSIGIILLIEWIISKNYVKYFSIFTLELQQPSLLFLFGYLAVLYIFSFFTIRADIIPSLPTLFLTIVFYIVPIFLLLKQKPVQQPHIDALQESNGFLITDLKFPLFLFATTGVIVCLLPALNIIFVAANITLFALGIIFAGIFIIKNGFQIFHFGPAK